MTQVITIDYHYSDDENPSFYDKPLWFGQKGCKLWDYTNDQEVPWDKSIGIVASIDQYILDSIKI